MLAYHPRCRHSAWSRCTVIRSEHSLCACVKSGNAYHPDTQVQDTLSRTRASQCHYSYNELELEYKVSGRDSTLCLSTKIINACMRSLVVFCGYNQATGSSHIAYFSGDEVIVIAQEMRSWLTEDCNEVDIVGIPHYSFVLFRHRIPCITQSR